MGKVDNPTKSLDYYLRASAVTDQKQKRAVLLYLSSPDVQEIFETLPNTGDDYKTALEKLNAYFQPKRNIPFERHVFRQASQQPDESMDVFVPRLRTLSKTCDFGHRLLLYQMSIFAKYLLQVFDMLTRADA